MNSINFDFLAELNLDDDVKERLSQHLYITYMGKKDALISPIAREFSPSSILKSLDELFEANKNKMNSTLLELEYSNKAKFGPRSIAVPWKDRVNAFKETFDFNANDKSLEKLVALGRPRLRPLSLVNSNKLLKNSTNSGLPFYTKKGLVKERVLEDFDELLKRRDPCILFTRTQEQKKTRAVWGYPIVDTLNEMRYYSPLLEYQKRLDYRKALLQPDEVAKSMSKLISRAHDEDLILLSIDFSAYDTTVKRNIQKKCFDYIKSLFQKECSNDIDYIFERFNEIGIVTPSGILKGQHGVPSGSTFTNEVDSIAQSSIGMAFGVKATDFQVQGDDGVYLIHRSMVNALIKEFTSYGLVVNEDKSFRSQKFAVYLQNLFHKDYEVNGFIGGIYPVYRALNRIIYQERWSTFEDFDISGKDYYSIRTICILENCKYHPLFKEFVKFILERDKYSLDYTEQGLSKYVQMMEQTKGAVEVLNHQYGDNVSGINNFETVKVIKELG